MIGGEHLVTLGAMRAVVKQYPDVHIIHFDAHADLREDYLEERFSHATVLHRVWIWLVTEKSFNSVFVPETVLNLFGQKTTYLPINLIFMV